ncbi:hypothetical protein Droror1_Dr00026515 [Drosera rotundifolia]
MVSKGKGKEVLSNSGKRKRKDNNNGYDEDKVGKNQRNQEVLKSFDNVVAEIDEVEVFSTLRALIEVMDVLSEDVTPRVWRLVMRTQGLLDREAGSRLCTRSSKLGRWWQGRRPLSALALFENEKVLAGSHRRVKAEVDSKLCPNDKPPNDGASGCESVDEANGHRALMVG